MRRIAISLLSVFVAFPAFAAANLPIVNVSAGSVSAREMFGEKPKPVVVPRKTAAVIPTDILSPMRPSGDLWARSDTALRMPEPAEFAVLTNDFELPEENLEDEKRKTKNEKRDSDVDLQIARLIELQKKADESTKPSAIGRIVVPADAPTVSAAVPAPKFVNLSENDLSKMSPGELKKAFKKTYLSENKHLSTYPIDDRFDIASDAVVESEGFTSARDLSESGGIRPLEIKIGFRNDDSALSRDNYNLLSEYAAIIVSNPKRAIQISIPERTTRDADGRKLAARRLAIVEQVLRDTGISDTRIMPVLANRNDDGFVLRVISSDQFETLTQQRRDMFGDSVSKKTFKSMTW